MGARNAIKKQGPASRHGVGVLLFSGMHAGDRGRLGTGASAPSFANLTPPRTTWAPADASGFGDCIALCRGAWASAAWRRFWRGSARAGIALPEMTAQQGSPGDSLIRAIEGGDVEAFRKIAAEGFDPETIIQFSRPDFAGGRVISGPALNATVLFGRAEMTRLLLSEGASVDGRPRRAICMAVAMRHREIVEMLVRHGLKVDGYAQCGRSRNLSPLELAERLNLTGIAEILREAGG